MICEPLKGRTVWPRPLGLFRSAVVHPGVRPPAPAPSSRRCQKVQTSTSEEEKVNSLAKNIQSVGGTELTLL